MNLPEATKVPCNDCPWRRKSARGWLGPMDADGWIEAAHGEQPIACHITINRKQAEWDDPGMKQCAGVAQFRANIFKSPRNPDIAVAEERDTTDIFGTDDEFKQHHKGRR